MIYFAQAADRVKIGFTGANPRLRHSKIQTDCPLPVTLLGAIPGEREDEKRLQNQVREHRVHGDWFHFRGAVVDLVKAQLALPNAWRPPCRFSAQTYSDPVAYMRRAIFKISQAEFAAISGVTQATVSRWENGEGVPHLTELDRIRTAARERALAWNDDWLFKVPVVSAGADA